MQEDMTETKSGMKMNAPHWCVLLLLLQLLQLLKLQLRLTIPANAAGCLEHRYYHGCFRKAPGRKYGYCYCRCESKSIAPRRGGRHLHLGELGMQYYHAP